MAALNGIKDVAVKFSWQKQSMLLLEKDSVSGEIVLLPP
jgi:hypothetical protein